MTDEEILRKKLDWLIENSHYGIMTDNDMFDHISMIMNVDQAEIAKIVHSYIERDIGCGTVYDRLNCPKPPIYIKPVKLMTLRDRIIEEAAKELQNKVDKLILKEDNKMKKATSVQKIENVNGVSFSIENHPMETTSKLIIVASTNDDIFAFEFEGRDLLQSCKAAGLFTGWEKDQKIRELEEDLSNWKKEAADCLKLRDEAQKEAYKLKKENEKYEEKIKKLEHDDMLDKNAADYWSKEHDILLERFAKLQVENEKLKDKLENVEPFRALERTIREKQEMKEEYEDKIDDLQHKYNLERAANEAQHKFFREYAGNGTEIEFNYAIGDGDEVTYVIVDKKEYQSLMDSYSSTIHGTIENFADEKPSTRADILDQAKKCVCGQREQDYGTPESNFQLIADLWNGYFGEKTDNPVISVTPVDVSMMMALMKIARIRNGGGSGDSFVDLAGYAACGGEIWHGQKAKDQN